MQLQPWLPRLLPLANIALVILIGLMAARVFWLLWPQTPGAIAAAVASQPGPTSTSGATVNVDLIAAAHLFGTEADHSAAVRQIIQAPETRLNLTLTGIVASNDGRESRALIQNAQGERPYAIGDTIVDQVKLHAIYTNRVILDRGGRFETLTLEREKLRQAAKQAAQAQTPSGNSELLDADLAADLAVLRRKILQQPSLMADYLRLQPERQGGSLVGYRVFPGPERALFQRVGLRPGALVTQVNGVPLTDPSQALKMLGELARAPRITLTVKRGGHARTITVSFK